MFTGIVEEIGTVKAITHGERSAELFLQAKTVLEGTRLGDSIAVNGVCLTVTSINHNQFTADVMAETLRRSSLGDLKPGSPVNLERAMAADGRFGGHIVSGHIDGTGKLVSMEREDNAVWLTIQTAPQVMRYIVEKGSIAIDGVSLTVAAVKTEEFQVSLIPHTVKETILLQKEIGAVVNLENDVIGKYVDRLLHFEKQEKKPESRITQDFLAKHGF